MREADPMAQVPALHTARLVTAMPTETTAATGATALNRMVVYPTLPSWARHLLLRRRRPNTTDHYSD